MDLPANLAVAIHPREKYSKIQVAETFYWIGESLVESFAKVCKFDEFKVVATCTGSDLAGQNCKHPFIERISPILEAEYVTMDSGTGCVHLAPGHGLDDYLTGLQHGLDVYCPIDDNGCYVQDDSMPDELVGISVLEKSTGCAANQKVLEILRREDRMLAQENHHHQYPTAGEAKRRLFFGRWISGLFPWIRMS